MHTTFSPRVLCLLFLLGLSSSAACRKKDHAGLGAIAVPVAHAVGTPHTDEVLTAWRNAGLLPEGFTAQVPAPYGAVSCERGSVQHVDTLVCEYSDDASLQQGTDQVKAEWARIDVHTGVALHTKRTLLVATDRERREPSGKTIRQMAKLFEKL